MSAVSLMDLPAESGRGPGRPRAFENPNDRYRHIKVAYLRHVLRWPFKKIAKRYHCTPQTVRNWIKLALTYDEPEAETLRQHISRY